MASQPRCGEKINDRKTCKVDIKETTSPKLQTLVKALRLLKLFSSQQSELRVRDMTKHLGYHKSSLHRLITTLEAENFLEKSLENPGYYRLGVEALILCSSAQESIGLRAAARPSLKYLVNKTQETAHLGVSDDFQVYYLEKIDSPQAIRLVTRIGQRIPIHTSSMGKSMLAFQDSEVVKKGVESQGLTSQTEKSISSLEDLLKELKLVRRQGYALDDEEWSVGVKCVGAPIFNREGAVVAAISLSGPAQRFGEARLAFLIDEVRNTARTISRRLGFQGEFPGGPELTS
jgi:IclR family KDG regulon transcriptional repressor